MQAAMTFVFEYDGLSEADDVFEILNETAWRMSQSHLVCLLSSHWSSDKHPERRADEVPSNRKHH